MGNDVREEVKKRGGEEDEGCSAVTGRHGLDGHRDRKSFEERGELGGGSSSVGHGFVHRLLYGASKHFHIGGVLEDADERVSILAGLICRGSRFED